MNFRKPDFLIIGAAKCATTWLQVSLQRSPQIFMPDPELHFFSREFSRGMDWYLAHFALTRDDQHAGEKSNSYLSDPAAIDRIAQALPHSRLIVQLRDPVERAYSDYCMLFRRGEVDGRIAWHLDPDRAAGQRFLADGLYGAQLRCLIDHFPREQVLVLFYENVRSAPDNVLRTVADFLDIGLVEGVAGRVKDKAMPLVRPGLRRMLRPMKNVVGPFRRHAWFKTARGFLTAETRYPVLTPQLRARLQSFYMADRDALSQLIGRVPDKWSSPAHNPVALPCRHPPGSTHATFGEPG